MSDFRKELISLIRKFKKAITFGSAKLKDGSILSYEGDTPDIGIDVTLEKGTEKIPAPDGDYEVEDGRVIVAKGGKIIDLQQPDEKQKKAESEFVKYLKSEAYKSDEKFNPEEYPWDKCIEEQTDKGADCPECVCAAIKNRTVKYVIENKLAANEEEAVTYIAELIKTNGAFKYVTNVLNKTNMDNISLSKEVAEIKATIAENRTEFEKQFAELKRISTSKDAEIKKSIEFSNQIIKLFDSLPDGESKKPKEKNHKEEANSLREFKKKYLSQ